MSGNMFRIALDVYEQLPFFAFIGNFLCIESQKDIKRYLYSSETKTPPYSGDFGSQPSIWVDKYFMIKGMREFIKNKNKKV